MHLVTYLWKLQCCHAILVGYGPACPKFSETANCQYLWKGLSDFVYYQVDFLLPLKLQKISCYFGYDPKKLFANLFAGFFTFDLFDLLILIPGVRCYIVLVLFNMFFYTQIDGVAMGSPLGLSLANAFLCHHEIKWLNDCPKKFKPVFYKRCVDGFFVLFERPEHTKPFADYMNSKHKNINFSFETEKDGQILFFDVSVFHENGKFLNNVYRKESLTGVYTNICSFIPLQHKFGLIYTSLYRSFYLVSDMCK